MPGDDLRLDEYGDYIDDGAGAFELTATAQPAVRHQVLGRLGEWIGDVTAGRSIRGLAGRRNTEKELDGEADAVRAALEVLVGEGVITDVRIETDRDARGRWGLKITCRDTQAGGTIEVSTLTEFGG